MRLCGISSRFQLLSPCIRQVAHALLTRPPLNLRKSIRVLQFSSPVRLACVKHAASVHPEPGSNSLNKFEPGRITLGYPVPFYCFKGQFLWKIKLLRIFQGCLTVQLSRFCGRPGSSAPRQLFESNTTHIPCQALFYIKYQRIYTNAWTSLSNER